MKREQATKYKETILIVDDMEINQEILTEMLKEDYNLIKAYDGQEAIDLLEKKPLGDSVNPAGFYYAPKGWPGSLKRDEGKAVDKKDSGHYDYIGGFSGFYA